MSAIEKYEWLKVHGTWIDRCKYIRSLSDKTQLERYLRDSSSVDDLGLLVFYYKSSKDKNKLLELANSQQLPVEKRCQAIDAWFLLETDEKQVHECIVTMLNNVNIPRKLKNHVVKCVRKALKSRDFSSTFCFNVGAVSTQSMSFQDYNIITHILPYCSSLEQVGDLLNRWSITKFSHIDHLSQVRIKLVRYHPFMVLQLIKADLESKYTDPTHIDLFFQQNRSTLVALTQEEPKGMCELLIDHLNTLEPYRRALPHFIVMKIRQLFRRVPDQIIQLIQLVASHSPGEIKVMSGWSVEPRSLDQINFPSSLSIEYYVQLFFVLYDTCKWSANHLSNILELMLKSHHRTNYAFFKERQWFLHTVVKERIGIEEFIKILLRQANTATLNKLSNYFELTTPLARHLLAKLDRKTIIADAERLNFLYFELMTAENFNRCLTLFKEISSEMQQRKENYPKLFKCSIATDSKIATETFEWILKRFKNEQLIVVEDFIHRLTDLDDRFHVAFVPHHQEAVEAMLDIAINHIQRTENTLEGIQNFGITLLKRAEYCRQLHIRNSLHSFGSKIIKKCLAIDYTLPNNSQLPLSLVDARRILLDILVGDIFPKMVEESLITQLKFVLDRFFIDSWREPKINTFLDSFFFDHLRTSKALQTKFKINEESSLIGQFLKQKSTRVVRAQRLIDEIGPIFLLNEKIQQIIVKSGPNRKLIDRLLESELVVTGTQLANEGDTLLLVLDTPVKMMPIPGLDIATLRASLAHLTGKQQKHIVNIILNSYLQEKKVADHDKLKALRILSRIPSMYDFVLGWIHKMGKDINSSSTAEQSHRSRGRAATESTINDIILCLPTSFDVTSDVLIQEFHKLKNKLNAGNAKYISDAMAKIAEKLPTTVFLPIYLEFISDEQFGKLGIAVNKEMLRLLIKFKNEPNLIMMVIQPLWIKQPHQDIRVCLIDVLLRLFDRLENENMSSLWLILDQAAKDEYLPVVQNFFSQSMDNQRWPLAQLANMGTDRYITFVNRIQFSVLNHPTKLEARKLAWSHIDDNYCDTSILAEKTKALSCQFDKDSNLVWEAAFKKMIVFIEKKRMSSDILIDIFQSIMTNRDMIDSVQNAIDSEHDLPVYRRFLSGLDSLTKNISKFTTENENSLRAIAGLTIQFDVTLAKYAGLILIGLAKTRDDLYAALNILKHHLSDSYLQQLILELATKLDDPESCPFVGTLSVEDKLALVHWFTEDKEHDLFVFDLAVDSIFCDSSLSLEVRQELLRRFRKSNNTLVRQKALTYQPNWTNDLDDDRSNSDMST